MGVIALAPEENEIEISLFGPGYGECVVVHLGSDHWVVVDSCIDVESRRPVAVEYLEILGRDPAGAVKCVVASHW